MFLMAYVVNITAILSAEHVLHSAVFFLLMIVYIYLIHKDTTVKAVSSLSIFLTDNYEGSFIINRKMPVKSAFFMTYLT